jgi:hypothetical protein
MIRVGDADLLMAMTSVGAGFFPVHLDASGIGCAARREITGAD